MRALVVLAALAVLGPALTGQLKPGQPYPLPGGTVQGQQGQLTVPQHPLAPRAMGVESPYRDGFQGMQSLLPSFQGFPTFPPSLPGYGGYPAAPGSLLEVPDLSTGRAPPPRAPQPPDWPSWIPLDRGKSDYQPDRAVLVRDADRVWFRAADEEVFIPLAFYDKSRVITAGAAVEVRGVGDFQIAFHGGTRILAMGRTQIEITELDETKIAVALPGLSNMRVYSRTRPIHLRLPDGSMLIPEVPGPEKRGTDIGLSRQGERFRVENYGAGKAVIQTPAGEITVQAGQRVMMLLARARDPFLAQSLRHDGDVVVERDGRRLLARGTGGGGELIWSGARFAVPQGTTLELDALQGVEFPDGKVIE